MNEYPLLLDASRALVGIMTCPPRQPVDPARPAIVLLNSGLVHRVGPNRLYVAVARRLAERGFVSVRFDFSQIGDSLPRPDSLPFQQSATAEVSEVMGTITERTGIHSFCLMGLCSGALISLATALADHRVVGTALLNPQGFFDSQEFFGHVATLSEGRIYAQNLLKLDSWRRLITGKTNYRRLGETLLYRMRGKRSEEIAAVVDKAHTELDAFFALDIQVLLLLCEHDRSIENFSEILGSSWHQQLGKNVQIVTLANANHTFSSPVHLRQAVEEIESWVKRCWPPGG